MRTTLDIADDVLEAARERARREKKSLGEVISDLTRQALTAPPEAPTARAPAAVYGVRPFPKRGGIVTNDTVDRLRDDDAY
jgi:hypothetical protein